MGAIGLDRTAADRSALGDFMQPRSIAAARALKAQAGYLAVTGIWPLLHRRSFEAVTGPKADFWLVRTVGVTVAGIGSGLALAARRERLSQDMRTTALLAAAGLCAIDVFYVARRRIRPVYLLDAVAEAAFVAALATGWEAETVDVDGRA